MSRATGAGERSRAIHCAVLAVLAGLVVSVGPVAASSVERQVQAAYLVKFGLYVQWPEGALGPAGNPLNLCVVGDDPFGPTLDDVAEGQLIGDRSVRVIRLPSAAASASAQCALAFAAGTPKEPVKTILEALRGTSTLTVTDASSAGGVAGVVHFVVVEDRVRFEIDRRAAAEQGLEISSRLLGLAVAVR